MIDIFYVIKKQSKVHFFQVLSWITIFEKNNKKASTEWTSVCYDK